jgi:hypothetical protein
MSLFSSLGQGDVWSIAGISFGRLSFLLLSFSFSLHFYFFFSSGIVSPVNDILDKDHYTLEELLGETELIQEVKTGNQRLIQL